MRIGIDLMGSDAAPRLLIPAIVEAARQLGRSAEFLVWSTPSVAKDLASHLSSFSLPPTASSIVFQTADEVIGMEEDPLIAVRKKSQSTLVRGIHQLKEKAIDAFVSCGNTGALVAAATLSLPHLAGVARPGLLAVLPTEKGVVAILDVGGNVSCKAEHLLSYAYIGSVYARVAHGIVLPKVGLLNIGTEAGKGTEEVREAYRQLEALEQERAAGSDTPFQFCGNIEGRDLFRGGCDVVVTDGFSGNIMLKTAEGVSAYILDALNEVPSIGRGSAGEAFDRLRERFDYTQHPGAFICGVDALVFKVHGNADAGSLFATILNAAECISNNLIGKLTAKKTP